MVTEKLILLDVDGVLADFVGGALKAVGDAFDRHFTPEQVTAWDFSSLPHWNDFKDEFWQLTKSPGFCLNLKPFPDAIEGVNKLRQVPGAKVEFLTSPMYDAPFWVFEREAWLQKYFNVDYHDIMHVRRKERVPGFMLVDDRQSHVEKWRLAHPSGTGIVWAKPYNEGTIKTWEEVIELASH